MLQPENVFAILTFEPMTLKPIQFVAKLYKVVQKSGHPYCFSGVRFLDHPVGNVRVSFTFGSTSFSGSKTLSQEITPARALK